MSIVPAATPEVIEDRNSIVVRAKRKNGRLVITDAVANDERLTVVLDTGSQITVGNEALRRRLSDNLVDVAQTVELESVTGQKIVGSYMFIKQLSIGGVNLTNLAVVFTDAHTFKQLGLDKRPALLLGMAMFEDAAQAFSGKPKGAPGAPRQGASEVDALKAELDALKAKVDKLGH